MMRTNPLFAKYKLACTFPGCTGKSIVEQAQSAGLQLGELVPEDSANPNFARCPRCRRCLMKVVEGPPLPDPKGPEGFTRLPTR